MADLKIYNNGENKILMSAGDRIIKQPYDFGKGLFKVAGVTLELNTENKLNSVGGWTILIWTGNQQQSGDSGHITIEDDLAVHSLYTQANAGVIYVKNGALITSQALTISPILNGISSTGWYIGASSGFLDNLSNVSKISLGFRQNSIGGTKFQSTAGGQNDQLIIYNRLISSGEYKYIFQNGLGASPQLQTGLLGYYEFEKAEILNYGSEDAVGIRNMSEDPNKLGDLKYLNLPAGTLLEQMDYANAETLTQFRL